MTGGWAEAFLEMMAVERAAARNTLTAYGRDLEDASAYLAGRGRDLSSASAEDVEAYFAHLGARGLSASTAARRRAAVRQFYRFVLGEGWRSDDPSRRIDAPKQGRPLPKVLSREEVSALIASAGARDGAQGLRLNCMIELIYASGLRVSELLALPMAALARDPAYLMVRGKGGKERLAPLNDTARVAVKAYLEVRAGFLPKGSKVNPWLFPSRGAGGRLTARRFAQMLDEAAVPIIPCAPGDAWSARPPSAGPRRRGCRSGWSRCRRGRKGYAPREGRPRLPAGGSRRRGAARGG